MDTHNVGKAKYGGKAKHRGSKKILGILLVVGLFLGVLALFVKAPTIPNVGFNDEETQLLTNKFQITVGDEEPFSSVLPAEIDETVGKKIVMTRVLTEGELYGNSLLFYCKQADVSVYLDDELLITNENREDIPFTMTPGSRWFFMRMPADYAGRELRIEIVYALESFSTTLPAIYMGTKSAFLFMILGNAKVSLCTGISLIVLGLLMAVSGLLIENRKIAKRICTLGTLAVVISVWMLLESQITQLFTNDMGTAAYVLFSFFNMLPILGVSFFLTYDSINKQWYMHVLFWISIASYVTVLVLQIFGISYYMNLLWVVHVQVIVIALGLFGCYADWVRNKKEEKSDESIYAAMVFLVAFVVIDIIRNYLYPGVEVGKYIRIGMIVFLAYLGFYAVKQLGELRAQEARENLYKELAYTDMMTGLSNRTAFEETMEELRKKGTIESVIILIADVNNLKRINDNFGHPSGDDAIISTAHTLKEIFGDRCQCFRIGGDEFCVIAQNIDEKVFEEKYRKFSEQVGIYGHEKIYPFAVATGYKVVKDNNVDVCLKQADLLMYEIKALMKKTETAGSV